jgi:hypothetical protein
MRAPRPAVVVGVVACAVLALQIALFHAVRLDDAYITFRYGKNLASGLGLVFNPHDRLMGSTSPGETLLSALAYPLVGTNALPGVMSSLGCVGWTGQAVAVFLLFRRGAGTNRAGFAAAALALGAAGSAHWLPLETNVTCACSLVAIWLGLEARWRSAAVVCAFAALMRADAYLCAVPLAALCVRDLRLGAWKPALVLGALGSPWPLFATIYFGSPIPQSAIAKFHQAEPARYAVHLLRDVPGDLGFELPTALTVLFWGLAVAGGIVLVRGDGRAWVVPAWGGLHAIAYVTLAPNEAHLWHLFPLTLIATALGLLALGTAVVHLPRRLALALVPLGLLLAVAGTVRFALSHATASWYGARDRTYRAISAYLTARADPTDIVDAEEVGTVGYYTGLRMNDHARIVTRYPGDVFWRLDHGRPTRLRWMIVNGAQVALGRERPYYEGHVPAVFDDGVWRLWVYDLKDGASGRAGGL